MLLFDILSIFIFIKNKNYQIFTKDIQYEYSLTLDYEQKACDNI